MAPCRWRNGAQTCKCTTAAAPGGEAPNGLIMTASVVQREEKRLATKGPSSINIGKELTNFENGRLPRLMHDFWRRATF